MLHTIKRNFNEMGECIIVKTEKFGDPNKIVELDDPFITRRD